MKKSKKADSSPPQPGLVSLHSSDQWWTFKVIGSINLDPFEAAAFQLYFTTTSRTHQISVLLCVVTQRPSKQQIVQTELPSSYSDNTARSMIRHEKSHYTCIVMQCTLLTWLSSNKNRSGFFTCYCCYSNKSDEKVSIPDLLTLLHDICLRLCVCCTRSKWVQMWGSI